MKVKTKAKKKVTKKAKPSQSAKKLQGSKTKNFLKNIRENNSMIEYITNLRIMNPAAKMQSELNEPRREGGFVRLAHAREEFTAPILTKGKSVENKRREKAAAATVKSRKKGS